MLKAKCIEKIRDKNNHIIGYTIIGNDKKPIPVKPEKLKEVIRSGQLEVVNLTLTSDNRLVDKKPDTPSKPTTAHSKQNINVERLFNRIKSLGYNVKEFDTTCKHKCYIASSPDNTKHLFIIPDDVRYIYEQSQDIYRKEICKYMSDIKGTLKVVGGKNLISTQYMFYDCEAQSLDLRSLNTSKVKDMSNMFWKCRAQSIDLSSFNTSKVTNMSFMFCGCEVQSLDLSSFNTSNVTNMSYMFDSCEAQSIDLSSFNTSRVVDMGHMFNCCAAQSLNLRSFITSNVINMSSMFSGCEAKSLDLSSFDTSKVDDMYSMFEKCEAQSLDLSSFNIRDVTNVTWIFSGCTSQIKVNDPKLKAQLQSDKAG